MIAIAIAKPIEATETLSIQVAKKRCIPGATFTIRADPPGAFLRSELGS